MEFIHAARFDDLLVRSLPGDTSSQRGSRQVRDVVYSLVQPTPVSAPRLLAWSDALGSELGLAHPRSLDGPDVAVLAGNALANGMRPYAARYGGHQFGHWAGQLGDGRAMVLGEWLSPDGSRYELQLKGAGPTPYSRGSDGRAVLRSSLREFVCSEAMHHLGIATTRALSLVSSGDGVVRDMLYDGHPRSEPGAIVCRVAPSFLRFGNLEILAADQEPELLQRLLDFHLAQQHPQWSALGAAGYAPWFAWLCRMTAKMIAHWMRVGFVHGVMNTDNMSLLGLTIDYGPYGWLEGYDPQWTPNTTDANQHRYAYGRQPQIALWNLSRLAGALMPLIARDDLEAGLDAYRQTYEQQYRDGFAGKLGLNALDTPEAVQLLEQLLEVMSDVETDFTIFFRNLARFDPDAIDIAAASQVLQDAFYDGAARTDAHQQRLLSWLDAYRQQLREQRVDLSQRATRMNAHNPKYVARNYLAQQAIDAAEQGDTTVLERLLRVLQRPYNEQPEHEELAARRPEWARHRVGCSALSCSS